MNNERVGTPQRMQKAKRGAPDAPFGAVDDYLSGQATTWTDRATQAHADAVVAAFRAGYKIGWQQALERSAAIVIQVEGGPR